MLELISEKLNDKLRRVISKEKMRPKGRKRVERGEKTRIVS